MGSSYTLFRCELKSDVSNTYDYTTAQSDCTYTGLTAQPHAVRKVGTTSYCYDQNGNMTKRGSDALDWYSYNLPKKLRKGSNSSQWSYGADRSKYKQVSIDANGTETTIYIGSLFEKVSKPSGATEYKHYIPGGEGAAAIFTRTISATGAVSTSTVYLHKDHLGSVDTITGASGQVLVRLSYDAFGKRRNAADWKTAVPGGDTTQINALTHDGYTGHDMLDSVDLIHMNGRVFDPSTARFISSDPYVQAPSNSQSLNRYSYVMNNPLSATDPSGYWSLWKGLESYRKFHSRPTLKGFFVAVRYSSPWQKSLDRYIMTHKWAYAVGQAVCTYFTAWGGGFGGAVFNAYATYWGTGSMSQAVWIGSVTYVSNVMFQGVNKGYGNNWNLGRVTVEGVVGGASTAAAGGDFQQGFEISAALSLARGGYRKFVRFKETWAPGEGIKPKFPWTRPREGFINIGTQGGDWPPTGYFQEGGPVSLALNNVPGINAVAGLHNFMMISLSEPIRTVLNVPLMLPAAALTYGALIADSPMIVTYEPISRRST